MKFSIPTLVAVVCCTLRRVQSSPSIDSRSKPNNHVHCFGSIDPAFDSCSIIGKWHNISYLISIFISENTCSLRMFSDRTRILFSRFFLDFYKHFIESRDKNHYYWVNGLMLQNGWDLHLFPLFLVFMLFILKDDMSILEHKVHRMEVRGKIHWIVKISFSLILNLSLFLVLREWLKVKIKSKPTVSYGRYLYKRRNCIFTFQIQYPPTLLNLFYVNILFNMVNF